MAGRALAFSDPEVVKTLREDFVAVAGDDWYRRRQEDKVGEFFRKVAGQGPRKGEGGSTRQGLYAFTSDGELLSFRNSADPGAVKEILRKALEKWRSLDTSRRKAKRFDDERGKDDPRYARSPPPGGLILRVHARELDAAGEGGFSKAAARRGISNQASLDHLWLHREEWQALVPPRLEAGSRHPVPPAVVRRIARFHLIDNTRGEPPLWQKEDVRRAEMALVVEKVEAGIVTLRLDGKVHLETAKADRGYEARIAGVLEYDQARKLFTRFDAVAIGEHWGEGTYTRGARPGRAPLGIAFALADLSQEADKIPPQAARDPGSYYGS